jgi:hypothetical protein
VRKRSQAKLHRSDFLREAKAEFPELRDHFNRQLCGLDLEMHVLCDHVQAAIENGDRKIVGAAYRLVERWFTQGNRALVNAVAVSFLEHLIFKDDEKCRNWAERMLPPVLAEERRDLFEYLRNPVEYVRKLSERGPNQGPGKQR